MLQKIPVLLTGIVILLISACRNPSVEPQAGEQKSMETLISGTLESGGGTRVMLEEMGAREYIPVDTVVCDDQGRFRIGFTPFREAFYALRIGTQGYLTLLVEPGQHVQLRGKPGEPGSFAVEGSEGSEILSELATEHNSTLEALARIARNNAALAETGGNADEKARLDQRFDSISDAFRDYSLDFIKEHGGSLAILIALHNMYGQGLSVFHPVQDLEVYQLVDSLLYPRYAGFDAVDLLHTSISATLAAGESASARKGPGIGEIAPDFVSSTPDGESVALTDYRGRYVLLAFWAGWSNPSRDENEVLRRAWNRFGNGQFDILQVSFDNNRETWLQAIGDDRLTWTHASDLNRWDTPVADIYQVDRIPANYLIGPGGKIIGRDLFGDELMTKLAELVKPE